MALDTSVNFFTGKPIGDSKSQTPTLTSGVNFFTGQQNSSKFNVSPEKPQTQPLDPASGRPAVPQLGDLTSPQFNGTTATPAATSSDFSTTKKQPTSDISTSGAEMNVGTGNEGSTTTVAKSNNSSMTLTSALQSGIESLAPFKVWANVDGGENLWDAVKKVYGDPLNLNWDAGDFDYATNKVQSLKSSGMNIQQAANQAISAAKMHKAMLEANRMSGGDIAPFEGSFDIAPGGVSSAPSTPALQDAWETLGKPTSEEEAIKNYKAMQQEVHPNSANAVRAGTVNESFASKLNQAFNLIKENGLPADLVYGGGIAGTPTPEQEIVQPKSSNNSQSGFVNPSEAVQGIQETIDNIKTALDHSHTANVVSQDVDQGLRTLEGQNQSDAIHYGHIYANTKLTPEEETNIYDAREAGTTNQLSPREKLANDQIITPLKDEQARIISKLKDRQLPISDEHNSRIIMDRGSIFDQIKQNIQGAKTKGGGLLTKTTGSMKRRVMLGLTDNEGQTAVISAKGGKITRWDKGTAINMGNYGTIADLQEGSKFVDKSGREWTIGQTTTKDIEANTKLKYSHYSLANELITTQRLQAAERASDWVEQFKNDPDFGRVAFKVGTGNIPEGWKITNAPQFRGYAFSPQVADEIDRYYQQAWGGNRDMGVLNLAKINIYVRNISLFNPLFHPYVNVLPNFLHAKGVVGLLNPASVPANLRAGIMAVRAVVNPLQAPSESLPSFTDLMDHGATLTSSHAQKTLSDALYKKLGSTLQTDPSIMQQFSKALGWANPMKWLDLLAGRKGISFRISMMSEDVARLQIIYSSIQNGMTIDDAVRQVDAIFPTNRVSTGQYSIANKVVGSSITRAITNPMVTQFAGYHASLAQTVANDAKKLLGKATPMDRAQAADRIAGLILGLVVLYPAYDALLKFVTKNPNAVAKRGGVFALLYNVQQLLENKENPATFFGSTFTLAPLTEALLETALNRDFFTGNQIIPQGTPNYAGQLLGAASNELIGNISIAQNASQISSGAKPFVTVAWSEIGVSIPKSSPSLQNVESLIYDQRTGVDSQIKKAVLQGDMTTAQNLANSFNRELLDNMVQAILEGSPKKGSLMEQIIAQVKQENGKGPNTQQLRTQLWNDPALKSDWLKMPSKTVMSNYGGKQGETSMQAIFGKNIQ